MTAASTDGWRAATCPRCGGAFECGARADRATPCFCVSFTLGAERLAELRAKWPDCLCAACLAALAREPEMPA
ncbi:MAG TPA: cysteine-rich CWC family protein [Burkholderiaceae bacterium]